MIILAAFMFMANTVPVTAWAKPCMHAPEHYAAVKSAQDHNAPCGQHARNMMTSGADETPAAMNTSYSNTSDSSDMKHCEDLCLCLHSLLQHTPVLNSDAAFIYTAKTSSLLIGGNDSPRAIPTAPPRRPPKIFS